jgi:nucleobase:cation symporter-1, NCS1 family
MSKPEYDSSNDEKNGYAGVSGEAVEAGYAHDLPKHKFGKFRLEVDQEPSSFARTPSASNADFDPIPPSRRTWGTGAYVAYWMADGWAVSNWEVG